MNGRKWTDKETIALISLGLAGRSHQYIATQLDRTVAAVSIRLNLLRGSGVVIPNIYKSRKAINYKSAWDAAKIKQTMLTKGITQAQLTKTTGLTKVTISNVLNGKSNGSERTRELINNNIFTKEE